MTIDKLVDSIQLDNDLAAVASAIRTKGGTSGQLAFPSGFVSAIDSISTSGVLGIAQDSNGFLVLSPTSGGGGGGDQTISFLDWIQQGCNNAGTLVNSTTRITTKHRFYKCKSITIPSGVELAIAAGAMPSVTTRIEVQGSFVGFWSGSAYTNSFTWFNSSSVDLTNISDWGSNYFIMFLRHPDNSNISASEGYPVVVTYDLADGAFIY